jgi:hypothetical protein
LCLMGSILGFSFSFPFGSYSTSSPWIQNRSGNPSTEFKLNPIDWEH